MSQFDFGTIDPNAKSGPQLALDLNKFRDALNSGHRGSTRPAYAQAGIQWVRETSSAQWDLMLFDGDTDFVLRSVNPTTNTLIGIPQSQIEGLNDAFSGLGSKYIGKDSATGAATLPSGTTAQRPAPAVVGMTRYNTTLAEYERYQGGAWVPLHVMDKAFNEAPIVTYSSASTLNIGAAIANTITITGTTAITSFTSIAAGATRRLVFQGALTLTHNAASLILPGAANITTAAGDVAEFVSLGGGNWRCFSYQRGSGEALSSSGLGQGQAWQDMTSSRVLGTTYTNSTGKPIGISGYVNNTSGGRISVTVGGVVVWNFMAASGVPPMPFTAVIPAGATYSVSVTTGTATLAIWSELR